MKSQKGGFALGLVVGLLLGLAVALGVALYVTKVPVPLMNKGQQRTPEQDAAEAQRNKNWDPNAALAGKAGASRPSAASASAPVAGNAASAVATVPRAAPVLPPPPASSGEAKAAGRDPAAILAGQGDAAARNAPTVADPYIYFVQAGAFAKPEDAEQQRAKLALQGFAAKVTEREQNGRTVHRVRLGPFDKKDDAEALQDKLKPLEVDASLVRVERAKQ